VSVDIKYRYLQHTSKSNFYFSVPVLSKIEPELKIPSILGNAFAYLFVPDHRK